MRKIPFAGIELTSQRVRGLQGTSWATGATGYTWCVMRIINTAAVVVVVVVVDSHIQRIVLATEETTVTQQVSHRPIKRQSRLWSQRGTKVNGSHHGDNPLLRPTGIQIATKSYAALQAMAPTNIKTVHQTSLLHSRATSIDSECCRLPTTSVLSKKPEKLRSNQFWSTSPSFSRPYILYRNKENRNTEVHGGGGRNK